MKVEHSFEPIVSQSSRILILGSMPSPISREIGFYYGHPRNRFWSVMSKVLSEALPKNNEERRSLLQRNHIALWDVLSSCDIKGAADSSIKNEKPNDIVTLIKGTNIKAVFLTGSTAYRLYDKHIAKKLDIPHFSLPSTSPANAKMSEDMLTEKYSSILQYLK